MSMLNRPADGAEVGETVASMREYAKAQKTVSQLIAGEVPARDIAIVGESVRTIERVTGKLGYATAARSGAINGLLIGLFLAAILVIGTPEAPIQLFVGFLLIGVAIGMILSLITFAIVRRKRDFASVTQLAADHYEVTVMPASLTKARHVLGGDRPASARPPVNLDEPPRYGERIPPGSQPGAPAGAPPAAAPPAAPPAAAGPAPAPTGAGESGIPAPAPPAIPPRPADPAPRYGERVTDAPTSPAAEASAAGGSTDAEPTVSPVSEAPASPAATGDLPAALDDGRKES